MTIQDIQSLAEAHGLLLTDKMNFNEMGIDFKVVFALDTKGQQWLLRIPRRDGMREQIKKEKRILELVKKHLSVEVPDWRISSTELVAYPILKDNPVLNLDAETYEIIWNMDKDSPKYITSLAKTLFEIHSIPEKEVRENDLKIMKPSDLRPEIANNLQLVKSEIGISEQLETRYRKWLDNDVLWADFTQFIHGDLYAGHVLASKDGAVSGVIDWSTAHIDDPAIDFAGHVTLFGEESLKTLIIEYEKLGGKVWNKHNLVNLENNPLVMYGNDSLLRSIFSNLLNNAIAYSSGTEITIKLVKETLDKYSFSLSDNGVGVEQEHLSHLFERFYRVDKGRSRKAGGTGLGLSIVKNAVIIHGGTISVHNCLPSGLQFDFSLRKQA